MEGSINLSDKHLKVATCQFSVSSNISANARNICFMLREASGKGADIVHFCETALSGYAGSCPEYGIKVFDVSSFKKYDWEKLRCKTHEIMSLAKKLKIWVVLGSTHYLSEEDKPANCLYVISSQGKIINRYDKCICTPGDLKVYSPGTRFVSFSVKGVKCGLLICADASNPNLYHEYRKRGVKVLFHSYYNARFNGPILNDKIVIPENICKAKEYGAWVFANNSSARHSCWATHVAGPKGFFRKLKRHVSGILFHELTPKMLIKDCTIHSGIPSNHPRARNGKSPP